MSIISEALKKVEQSRSSAIRLSDHTEKVPDPSKSLDGLPVRSRAADSWERRTIAQAPKAAVAQPVLSPARNEKPAASGWKRSAAIGSILLSTLCIFIVHDYITSEQYYDTLPSVQEEPVAPVEVEPYSNIREEVIKSEQRTSLPALTPHVDAKKEFFSSVQLSGIVDDGVETIAIFNNEILRVGEDVGQARIMGIEPDKVILSLKGESFDMLLK